MVRPPLRGRGEPGQRGAERRAVRGDAAARAAFGHRAGRAPRARRGRAGVTPGAPLGANFIPNRYRGVSVAPIPEDVELTEQAMRRYLLGRPAYRRTRFVVARRPEATAIVAVTRSSDTELFSPVVAVDLIAGPDECAYLVDPEADTGIPSVLAELAVRRAPGARAVGVQGRYAHVNFIVDPRPLRIVVREVVP